VVGLGVVGEGVGKVGAGVVGGGMVGDGEMGYGVGCGVTLCNGCKRVLNHGGGEIPDGFGLGLPGGTVLDGGFGGGGY